MKRCYNTFVVMDCKRRTPILVTSSARKARAELCIGRRIEVWNCNALVERIYTGSRYGMDDYVRAEKEYHAQKQAQREHYNRLRRGG